MALSKKLKATARKLIGKYGDSISIVAYAEGVYDPLTGTTPKSEAIIPTKATISFYSSNDLIEGVINMGDALAIIETDIALNKSFDIDYRGDRYNIIDINEVSAQDLTVIYKVQMRS